MQCFVCLSISSIGILSSQILQTTKSTSLSLSSSDEDELDKGSFESIDFDVVMSGYVESFLSDIGDSISSWFSVGFIVTEIGLS